MGFTVLLTLNLTVISDPLKDTFDRGFLRYVRDYAATVPLQVTRPATFTSSPVRYSLTFPSTFCILSY
jgi:hypothetical protein